MMLEILSCVLMIYMKFVICFALDQQPANIPNKSEHIKKQDDHPVVVSINVLNNASVTTSTSTKAPIIQNNSDSYIESGAVMRGVFVFVAITLLLIMYLVFKTYRKGNRKHVAIKKYGVRARRTDTEMEPLHLEDEEEDETLFIRSTSTR